MSVTHSEEVFERRPQQVDDHDVVVPLLARPHNPRNSRSTHESLIYFRLLFEGTRSCNGGFEFDGDLLTGHCVNTLKNRAFKGVIEAKASKEKTTRNASDKHNRVD